MNEILSLQNLPLLLTVCQIITKNTVQELFIETVTHDEMVYLQRVNEICSEEFRFRIDECRMSVVITKPMQSLMCILPKYTPEFEALHPIIKEFGLKYEL